MLQLPFVAHEYLVLVPKRVGLGGGIVPVDIVAGTFGAILEAGGANAVLAAYQVIVVACLLALWKNGALSGFKAAVLSLMLLSPMVVNQAKIREGEHQGAGRGEQQESTEGSLAHALGTRAGGARHARLDDQSPEVPWPEPSLPLRELSPDPSPGVAVSSEPVTIAGVEAGPDPGLATMCDAPSPPSVLSEESLPSPDDSPPGAPLREGSPAPEALAPELEPPSPDDPPSPGPQPEPELIGRPEPSSPEPDRCEVVPSLWWPEPDRPLDRLCC